MLGSEVTLDQLGLARLLELSRHGEGVAGERALAGAAATGHVVIADAGRMRAFGDCAGLHRTYIGRIGGIPAVSSHAGVLRSAMDAVLDPGWIAAQLCRPGVPHVLRSAASPYLGIAQVPPGDLVEIVNERVRQRRWWAPPEPVRSLDEGTHLLHVALSRAVRDRQRGRVSIEFSGGLDSSALAYLARPTELVMVTTQGSSPVDDDVAWAQRVAAGIPGSCHQVIDRNELPPLFDDLFGSTVGADEPCGFTVGLARMRHVAAVLRGHQCVLNLNGRGGDEVLLPPLTFLGRLPMRRSTTWLRYRAFAAQVGAPALRLVAEARRRESYGSWVARVAEGLAGRRPPVRRSHLGWEPAPEIAPWATPKARRLVADMLTAQSVEPLHADPAMHAAVARIRMSARQSGLYREAMAALGVPTAMPFFDDSVIAACLSVRPEERIDPWEPKPLLTAMLRRVRGAVVNERRTKAHYDDDVYRGFLRNRAAVRALGANSLLVRDGLVDGDVLAVALDGFGYTALHARHVTNFVALEIWLRDRLLEAGL